MSGNNEQEVLGPEAEAVLTDEAKNLIRVESREIGRAILALAVRNEQDYKAACVLGQRNKDMLRRIEAYRKGITAPMQESMKKINDLFRSMAQHFSDNQKKIDRAVSGYFASRKKTEEVKTVRDHDMGTRTSIQKRLAFEVLDPDSVPREWCSPDEVKIGRAVRAGLLKELPGLKIFEKVIPVYAVN